VTLPLAWPQRQVAQDFVIDFDRDAHVCSVARDPPSGNGPIFKALAVDTPVVA
jgi:hypothetical protein